MVISQKQSSFLTITTVTITLIAIFYYLVSIQWNVVEVLHFCLGIIALWMPLGALLYILLKQQVQEPIVHFTFRLRLYPSNNRKQIIKDLWVTSRSKQFCPLLMATPATHVIEYLTHPLLINNPPFIQPIWESSEKVIPVSSEKVTI
ncbi:MAG: hypothetical protein V7K89_22590 [Nostoc sp.]|uniref:hypothetical protein n=1 Tax=Nostoc sp. TaxID=1180 RepID=UPI002FF9229F